MNCKCGREYYPKQAWIHEPLCRYVDDVLPNHVPTDKRGVVNKPVLTINAPIVNRDRKAYMRDYMANRRKVAAG